MSWLVDMLTQPVAEVLGSLIIGSTSVLLSSTTALQPPSPTVYSVPSTSGQQKQNGNCVDIRDTLMWGKVSATPANETQMNSDSISAATTVQPPLAGTICTPTNGR